MGSDQIHRPGQRLRGIVFPDGFHVFRKVFCRTSAQNKRRCTVPEGIVHGTVQLSAQQIFPQVVIADFMAGILPDLSHQQRIGFFRLAGTANRRNKRIRQLVGHIQPPAGSPQPQPFADHAPLSAYKLPISRVVFFYVRQGIHAPPAFIARRMLVTKAVPAVIGAFGFVIGPRLRVISISVKIDAVVSGMAEHTVQNDADPHRLSLCAKRLKIRIRAESRVNGHVIRRVIFMVAGSQKYGIEVNRPNTHGFEIGQFFHDPL